MNNTPAPYEYPQKKPPKDFSPSDSMIAILLFIVGYLISSWVLFGAGERGLGSFTLLLIMSAASMFYLKSKKIRIIKSEYLRLAIIIILSLPLLISSNAFIKFLVSSYADISFIYWFFCVSGNRESEIIDDMIFFDVIKGALVLPFSCFADIFGAVRNLIKKSSTGNKILLIIAGIAIAAIPTAIVTILLISADAAFSNLAEKILVNIGDVPTNIFYFCFGVPIAMYIFGMMYANITHEKKDSMTREKNEKTSKLLRFLPVILTCSAITPVLLVYILFFFSQTSYFLSAFSGIRPENITFAEYARKGFFKLSAVSVINMLMIIAAAAFTKRKDGKRHGMVKGYIITLSVFTLALIAIAISKMFMYIDAYGLSLLRIYTTWFMSLLVIVFVFVIIKQLSEHFNFSRALIIGFTIMFALLIFSDADALTARYNINLYQTGKSESVDINMMYELSDSAVKYVIPLASDDDPNIAQMAKKYLDSKKAEFEIKESNFEDFNLSTYSSKAAIEKYYKSAKQK